MLCIYKANITGLQAEACKEYRESEFQCSSTSVGALSLQGAHCRVPCGIRSSSVECRSAQRSVSHPLLAQHICILLWSKWCRTGFSKAFDGVPVFLTKQTELLVKPVCNHDPMWVSFQKGLITQHVCSLSPSPWSGKFLSPGLASVQQALGFSGWEETTDSRTGARENSIHL